MIIFWTLNQAPAHHGVGRVFCMADFCYSRACAGK
ncbi:hypothetical protein LINGRAHAP2_LOCUS20766 [Linum grandiflorum]